MTNHDYSKDCCQIERIHEKAILNAKSKMPDEDLLYDVAELFKVFGDSSRIRILSSISDAELCVCDVANLLGMTKSAVSHQLRILRQNKLVKSRRDGKEIYYTVSDDHVSEIINTAIEHVKE